MLELDIRKALANKEAVVEKLGVSRFNFSKRPIFKYASSIRMGRRTVQGSENDFC